MKGKVTNELKSIFQEILSENKSENDWAEIESDDMFQTEHYCGGFDATEMAFCFSYFDEEKTEFWFQVNFNEIQDIIDGISDEIDVRPCEW